MANEVTTNQYYSVTLCSIMLPAVSCCVTVHNHGWVYLCSNDVMLSHSHSFPPSLPPTGTYIPCKEVVVEETIRATVIKPNQAIKLRARKETLVQLTQT